MSTDWRVLGGVIPGPIPVEWVRGTNYTNRIQKES